MNAVCVSAARERSPQKVDRRNSSRLSPEKQCREMWLFARRSHCGSQTLLRVTAPIAAIQLEEHRSIRNCKRGFDDQDREALACLIELLQDLLMLAMSDERPGMKVVSQGLLDMRPLPSRPAPERNSIQNPCRRLPLHVLLF
jgi:hypothetical protein